MRHFGETVDQILGEVMGDRVHPPQVAVGVVHNGQIVQFHGIDAAPDTRFRIASMTKSFTAAAILRLRDAGVWRLDDLLSRWVPETLSLKGPTADSPPITLRHLVTMSAGMATDDPWGDRQLDLDAASFRTLMTAGASFAVIPGTALQYSNFGYALLGEAIARATQQTPQRYITTEILQPLGMTATTWDIPTGFDYAPPHHRFADLDETPPLADGAFAPMGGLWSTVNDLAKWIGFLTDAFPARDGIDSSVLCRASRREMQQVHTSWPPQIVETARGPRLSEIGYGMGLMIGQHPSLGKLVNHSGGLPGYGSNMRWVPNGGAGVVGLANRTYSPMRSLTTELIERLADDPLFVSRDRLWPVSSALLPDSPMSDLEVAGYALANALWNDDPSALEHIQFAQNVLLDLPLSRRQRDALAARQVTGAVGPWALTPSSATSGTFSAQSASHTVAISISMSPQVQPLIQQYEVTVTPRPAL